MAKNIKRNRCNLSSRLARIRSKATTHAPPAASWQHLNGMAPMKRKRVTSRRIGVSSDMAKACIKMLSATASTARAATVAA